MKINKKSLALLSILGIGATTPLWNLQLEHDSADELIEAASTKETKGHLINSTFDDSKVENVTKVASEYLDSKNNVTKQEWETARDAQLEANGKNVDKMSKAQKDAEKIRWMVELNDTPAHQNVGKIDGSKSSIARINKETKKVVEKAKPIRDKFEKRTKTKTKKSFGFLVNGFSIDGTVNDALALQNTEGVKSIRPATVYTVQDTDANDLAGATSAWQEEHGLRGEGMVVAILDSGIDASHKDLSLSDSGSKAKKLSKEAVEEKISEFGHGTYETEKVPYGYNYFNNTTLASELKDGGINHRHGQHVAGIVAANGENADNVKSVQGVAPEAQLLNMKVFSNQIASTMSDAIVPAIEDSVKLGADILNLSLGTKGGLQNGSDIEQVALERAAEKGVLSVIAAGNDGRYSSTYGDNHSNSDSVEDAQVGTPGVTPSALTVASSNGIGIHYNVMNFGVGERILSKDETGHSVVELIEPTEKVLSEASYAKTNEKVYDPSKSRWNQYFEHVFGVKNIGSYPIVTLPNFSGKQTDDALPGYGIESEYYQLPKTQLVSKKIVVVSRGETSFKEKMDAAFNQGAAGLIIIDNKPNDSIQDMTSLGIDQEGNAAIPTIVISYQDGLKLVDAIKDKGANAALWFDDWQAKTFENPEKEKMSYFTSWGPTPNLELKPEITGIGGHVWSLDNDNGYQDMSGTSMATPFVAGSSALLMQHLKEINQTNENINYVKAVKTALENTSKPVLDGEFGGIYSPRRQGAGLVQVDKAVENTTTLTDASDNDGIFALKEMKKNSSFDITLTNKGKETLTYTFDNYGGAYTEAKALDEKDPLQTGALLSPHGVVGAEKTKAYEDIPYDKRINGSKVEANKDTITLSPGQSKVVKVQVKLPNDFQTEQFVEGYVSFVEKNGKAPTLSTPYFGFYGDYGKEDFIDPSIDEKGSTWGIGYLTDAGDHVLGNVDLNQTLNGQWLSTIDREQVAISNATEEYTDDNGETTMISSVGDPQKTAFPFFMLNREVESMKTTIVDSKGNTVRTLATTGQMQRTVLTNTSGIPAWNGTVIDQKTGNEKNVADGQYYFEFDMTGPLGDKQTKKYPIKVDSIAPTISNVDLKLENGKVYLTGSAKDNASGIWKAGYISVNINGHWEMYYIGTDVPADSVGNFKIEIAYGQERFVRSANNKVIVSTLDAAKNRAETKELTLDVEGLSDDSAGGSFTGEIVFDNLDDFDLSGNEGQFVNPLYAGHNNLHGEQDIFYRPELGWVLELKGNYSHDFYVYDENSEQKLATQKVTVDASTGEYTVDIPIAFGLSKLHFEDKDGVELNRAIPINFKEPKDIDFDPAMAEKYSLDKNGYHINEENEFDIRVHVPEDTTSTSIYAEVVENGVSVQKQIEYTTEEDNWLEAHLTKEKLVEWGSDVGIWIVIKTANGNTYANRLSVDTQDKLETALEIPKATSSTPVTFLNNEMYYTESFQEKYGSYNAATNEYTLRGKVYLPMTENFVILGHSDDVNDPENQVKIDKETGEFSYVLKNIGPMTFIRKTAVWTEDDTHKETVIPIIVAMQMTAPTIEFKGVENWAFDVEKKLYTTQTNKNTFDIAGAIRGNLEKGSQIVVNGEVVVKDDEGDGSFDYGHDYLGDTVEFRKTVSLEKNSDNKFTITVVTTHGLRSTVYLNVHQGK